MGESESKKAVGSILIVDGDANFLKTLRASVKNDSVQLVCAPSIETAEKFVEDMNRGFLAVFVSTRLDDEMSWISIVKKTHEFRPGVPIYLLEDSKIELGVKELANIGVRDSYSKPMVDFTKMVELVAPFMVSFDTQSAIKKAQANRDKLGQVSGAMDVEFTSIRADSFLSGAKSIFDLYVRLSGEKYVKILQAGDNFESDRIIGFLKKGVTHFHIKREAQETYLKYCQHLTSRIIKNETVPENVRVRQTLNVGEQTINFLQLNGITPEGLHHASSFVSNVKELLLKFNPKKSGVLQKFLKDLITFEHGVSTTMVASLIAKNLELESHQAVNIVGLSALFHDIGMVEMPEKLKSEDESQFSGEELDMYRLHPQIGAETLSEVPNLPPAVIQAVAHHHSRRGRKGFPSVPSDQRSLACEIVGISDEFVHLIKRSQSDPDCNPVLVMEQEKFEGFSKKVVNAFQEEFVVNAALERLSNGTG